MVRAALIACLVAASLCACGPSVEEGATRRVAQEGRAGVVVVEGMEVFEDGKWRKSGPFTFRNDEGVVIAEGSFLHGLEDGLWVQTVEDGSVGKGRMREGSRVDQWKWYHANGKLQDVGEYDRGVRTGLWRSYRTDGSRMREAEYENGEMHGRVTFFGPDGKTIDTERSGRYVRGKRKGD